MIADRARVDGAPEPDSERLPRLVYFADVQVENYMHGSALMYRLLERYPPGKLLIVEGLAASAPDRRLPGVEYRQTRHPRLMTTRFGPKLSGLYALVGGDGADELQRTLGDFRPEAVLSVIHLYQWLGAAAFCRRHRLPLHLIAHDRWQDVFFGSAAVKRLIAPRFAKAYRQAASRFCVSPHMVDIYEAETGVRGEVLYPARRAGFAGHATVSPRVASPGAPFTVAYAGSIPDPGLIEGLNLTARSLLGLGGRLIIFGPYSEAQLAKRGLAGENIAHGGSIPPEQLADRLRAEADVLAASVTFDPQYRAATELCFPSKLTDYTAAGLPILVHGPETCSAARWAQENPGVAEVVSTMDEAALRACFGRLIAEPARRESLAQQAMIVGDRLFAGDKAERTVFQALERAHQPSR